MKKILFLLMVPILCFGQGQIMENVEENPEFVGGMSKLYEYLGKNIQYPEMAKEYGIQGKVIVQFVVLKDGTIKDVRVVKGVHKTLDNEAQRVVKSMPKWNPGRQRGTAVNARFTLPIKFRNTNDNIKTIYFGDGYKFIGQIKNNLSNGQETLTLKNGNIYIGENQDDLLSGKGTLTYKNGFKYEGYFKDGLFSQGTYYYKRGDIYEGEWKDNLSNGKGTLTYKNGDIYIGEFKNDKFNGQGKFTYKNGEFLKGQFKRGKFI